MITKRERAGQRNWRNYVTPNGDQGAMAAIHAFLDPLGLGSLAQMAWDETLKGASWTQVLLDIRASDQYKAAFPAINDAVKNGDISYGDTMESQYRALVGAYRQVNQAYGLPQGFKDSAADIGKFISGRVSPTEYESRVKQYSSVVLGDHETLNQLQTLYGTVGHQGNPVGDLLAHYLDPDTAMPLLGEQLQAAQFAGAAARTGYGTLSRQQAELYGAQGNVTAQQAQEGFNTLARSRELMQGLPGEGQDQISQDVQLGAVFGGNAQDQEKLANRARLRVVEGQGGGGFTQTRTGASGLGSQQV